MKIWFRVGMEADVTEEEMKELLIYSGQAEGEYIKNCNIQISQRNMDWINYKSALFIQ